MGTKRSHEDERRVEVPFIPLAVSCYVRNITKCLNVVKFIRSRSSWSASLFLLCSRSSNTDVLTVWWNLADWGERGVDAVPYMNFGHLRRFHGFHSSYGKDDRHHFFSMTWSLMSCSLKNNLSISFCLSAKVNCVQGSRRAPDPFFKRLSGRPLFNRQAPGDSFSWVGIKRQVSWSYHNFHLNAHGMGWKL